MINDSSKLKKGQFLRVDIENIRDRISNNTLSQIKSNPIGKLVGYKMVDGNQFGLALEFKNKSIIWFFENEVSEITGLDTEYH